MDPRRRRPFWNRKCLGTALALWLAIAYPLSVGPANYAAARGWLPEAWVIAVYAPVQAAANHPRLMEPYVAFVMRWRTAALRHQGHIVDDPNTRFR